MAWTAGSDVEVSHITVQQLQLVLTVSNTSRAGDCVALKCHAALDVELG
jgi:hypothetical protein